MGYDNDLSSEDLGQVVLRTADDRHDATCRTVQSMVGLCRTGALLGFCVIALGCGPDTFGADELLEGVEVEVDDTTDAIESATVFLPPDEPVYNELRFSGRIAILQPGVDGFDAVVAYLTGPYCGVLPDVSVTGDPELLTVAIRTHDGGNCDAMEYVEAIGLQVTGEYADATIEAVLNS